MKKTSENLSKSSSHVQLQAEDVLFRKIEALLKIKLEKNKKIYLSNNQFTYIQPDFFSADNLIIGEIFSHIGKPKKAQDNKIANDILKMLLLEKVTGQIYRKIIIVCDISEKEKLEGKSVLAESIRQFGIEIMCLDIGEDLYVQLLVAQKQQRMTNI